MSGFSTCVAPAVALVLTSSVAGLWQHERGWLPSSARTIDINVGEMLLAPCRCGGTAWCQAGSGWACLTCTRRSTATKTIPAGANTVTTRTTAMVLAPRPKPCVKRREAQHRRVR
jgi:hypothetical protein